MEDGGGMSPTWRKHDREDLLWSDVLCTLAVVCRFNSLRRRSIGVRRVGCYQIKWTDGASDLEDLSKLEWYITKAVCI